MVHAALKVRLVCVGSWASLATELHLRTASQPRRLTRVAFAVATSPSVPTSETRGLRMPLAIRIIRLLTE